MIISVIISKHTPGYGPSFPIDAHRPHLHQLVGGPSCRRSSEEHRAQEMRFQP